MLEKIKAVLYARVSSTNQEKDGFSIPAQLELLRTYAGKHDIEIVREFKEAETAKQAGRHQFNEMLKFLQKNKDVKTILCEKTDRLYRNFKDYVNLDVDTTGYTVILVKEGVILSPKSNSHEKLQHGFKILLAKNFIDNLREETQKGRQQKIEEGYFIGQVPYGYIKTKDKCNTILHPMKSKFVKRAFELYAQGNISLKALTQRLYNEGFLYTTSHGKISTGQLEKMLKNDCYTGMLRYRSKLYHGKHEPIVSKQLFLKAQKAFKKDGKPDSRQGHSFLYKGMMTCAECGCTITSEIKKNKWIYYHCTGNAKPCSQKREYIKQEEFEQQIDEAIKRVVIDESLADYINTLLEDSYKEMQIDTKEKYDFLTSEINKLETRKNKLLDMYMDEEIEKEQWVKKTQEYDEQIALYQSKLNAMNLSNQQFLDVGKNIIESSKQAYKLYQKQSTEEKRKLLNIMFEDMTVKDRIIHYSYKKPFCYFAKCDTNDVEDIVDYIKTNVKGCI